jgi:hypothetical protein
MDRPNLTVVTRALVTRLTFKGNKATGVEIFYQGKTHHIIAGRTNERNYFISCLDDCSRKVASKWSERKRTIDVLDVLEEWIVINGKPKKVM